MCHREHEVRIHLGDPTSCRVVNEWQQDSTVFSVGMGIVLVCALPYKLLTASRTTMVDLAHPLPLSPGSYEWCYRTVWHQSSVVIASLLWAQLLTYFLWPFTEEGKNSLSFNIHLIHMVQKRPSESTLSTENGELFNLSPLCRNFVCLHCQVIC